MATEVEKIADSEGVAVGTEAHSQVSTVTTTVTTTEPSDRELIRMLYNQGRDAAKQHEARSNVIDVIFEKIDNRLDKIEVRLTQARVLSSTLIIVLLLVAFISVIILLSVLAYRLII